MNAKIFASKNNGRGISCRVLRLLCARLTLAAHEYFHAIQWGYQQACPVANTYGVLLGPLPVAWYLNEDLRWWMEATAEWAQQEAFSVDKSYAAPVKDYFNEPWQHIDSRSILGDPDNFAYSVLFPFYLIEHYPSGTSGKDIIKTTWMNYQNPPQCGAMLPTINRTLPQNQQITSIFPGYTEANYFLAYQRQADFRNVLANLQQPLDRPFSEIRSLDTAGIRVDGPAPAFGGSIIQHLGASYVDFNNGFDRNNAIGRRLTINLDLYTDVADPPLAPGMLKLWIIDNWTPPNTPYTTISPAIQDAGYIGSRKHYTATATIANFDGKARVTMVLTNSQPDLPASSFTYSAIVAAP